MGRWWFVICCMNEIEIGYLGKCWKSNALEFCSLDCGGLM